MTVSRPPEFPETKPEVIAAVSASTERDPERWVESYTQQTATMIHRRAVAQGNGHGYIDVEEGRRL